MCFVSFFFGGIQTQVDVSMFHQHENPKNPSIPSATIFREPPHGSPRMMSRGVSLVRRDEDVDWITGSITD